MAKSTKSTEAKAPVYTQEQFDEILSRDYQTASYSREDLELVVAVASKAEGTEGIKSKRPQRQRALHEVIRGVTAGKTKGERDSATYDALVEADAVTRGYASFAIGASGLSETASERTLARFDPEAIARGVEKRQAAAAERGRDLVAGEMPPKTPIKIRNAEVGAEQSAQVEAEIAG